MSNPIPKGKLPESRKEGRNRMYRVMLIDDEMPVRKLMRSSIDWASLDMEVVGEAASGIECFHEEKPPAQDEEDVNLFNLRGALPGHVYARAADWADCEPDFRYAYYYQRSEGAKLSWFGIGVLIDYDTGTFVAWA